MNIWQRIKYRAKKKKQTETGSKPVHPSPKHSQVKMHSSKTKPEVKSKNSIKYIVAIASGKGGVGKSTISSNLAFALQSQGFAVGLLDADIYGPSQAQLLGNKQEAQAKNGLLEPIENHGVKFISMSAVNPKGGAVIVRSPIAVRAVTQFLSGVNWGELDYLLIDLPPGTGDIQLTLAQKAQLSGVVVVTTPQSMAADIASKSLQMFRKVNVPILGAIENMSSYTCEHCQHDNAIFDEGGGAKIAQQHDTHLLGKLPLDPTLLQNSERGDSIIHELPESKMSQLFIGISKKIHQALGDDEIASLSLPKSVINNKQSKQLELSWPDGTELQISGYKLRGLCVCAACRDEITGEQLLKTENIAKDLSILDVKAVGRYGLGIRFSDQHATGIYRLDKLKELALANNKEE